MKSKKSIWIIVVLAFAVGAAAPTALIWNPAHWEWAERITTGMQGHATPEDESGETQLWTCGMHPQVIQDHPGTCPTCGHDNLPGDDRCGHCLHSLMQWSAPHSRRSGDEFQDALLNLVMDFLARRLPEDK